jgi:predicted dehydrogenase
MGKILGVGIIGCGNISAAYLKLAPLFNNIEVKAVADINMDSARARATEFGVKAQTVKELLKNDDISIVINLTVPQVHFKVSKEILLAGKSVYSEKPVTLSVAEGNELLKIAKKKKLRVASAPDTFMGGSHQLARQAIDDGKIGKVVAGTCHFMGHGMEMWHPNPDFFYRPGGGPVLDMGPYYIANLINFLGPVKRVAALSGMGRKERTITNGPRNGETLKVKTPTTYQALVEFKQGAMITLSLSWDVFSHKHQNMELYGTEGAMFVPDPNFFGGDVMIAGTDTKLITLEAWDHPFGVPNMDFGPNRFANYRCAGVADLADAIINKRDARCSIERPLHAVDVMTAIMKSGETGKFVTIKTTCSRPKAIGPKEARALMK